MDFRVPFYQIMTFEVQSRLISFIDPLQKQLNFAQQKIFFLAGKKVLQTIRKQDLIRSSRMKKSELVKQACFFIRNFRVTFIICDKK